MSLLQILKVIAAVGTILTGLYSLVRPKAIKGFTGLAADNPRAVTEIRSVLGGFFVALGALPLIFGSADMYRMLGYTYLVVGVVRLASMFVDKSAGEQSNWISLVVEVVLGVVLIL
jgi:hypothetical protein